MKQALKDKLIAFFEPMISEAETAAVGEVKEQIERLRQEVEEEPSSTEEPSV